ncbi:MAG: hypothetical protein ACRDOK_14535, partial [Streptosporangiaceae bacterium]
MLPADWQEAIMLVARRSRAYVRHPRAIPALQGRSAPGASGGPDNARNFGQCLAAVARSPLSPPARLDLLGIVDEHVRGHVLRASELAGRAPRATARPLIPDHLGPAVNTGRCSAAER